MSRRLLASLLAVAAVAAGTAAGAATFGSAPPPAAGEVDVARPPAGDTSPTDSAAERAAEAAAPRRPTAAQRRLAQRRAMQRGIDWRDSAALGTPNAGSLADGVLLPAEGVHFFSWDPVTWTRMNPPERRWGHARTIRAILEIARDHRAANPGAPRIAVGDIALPQGGSFDASHGILGEFGGPGTLGHVSHQNGLDVDVYYPRRDRRERGPDRLADIDVGLSQDLVDRFVAAGAQFVFVGPNTPLTGPASVVQPAERHDDHLHVRFPSP